MLVLLFCFAYCSFCYSSVRLTALKYFPCLNFILFSRVFWLSARIFSRGANVLLYKIFHCFRTNFFGGRGQASEGEGGKSLRGRGELRQGGVPAPCVVIHSTNY